MKHHALALLVVSMATNVPAAPAPARLKKGMAFQTADSELRRSGWLPQAMHVKNTYSYTGIEKTLLRRGVNGLEGCAVDRPVCIVHYEKGKACMRVLTWGEQVNGLSVDYWDKQCPPESAL